MIDTGHLTRFIKQRPFEPFTLVTADGRELHVNHPEFATLGDHVDTLIYVYPSGQVEIIDSRLIVSLRTIYPADLHAYGD